MLKPFGSDVWPRASFERGLVKRESVLGRRVSTEEIAYVGSRGMHDVVWKRGGDPSGAERRSYGDEFHVASLQW